MNKVAKIFSYIAVVFAFCCLSIGYAAVQDTLRVNGSVSVDGYYSKNNLSAADTEAYELKDDTLIISPTYYDSRERKNYRVTGIADEGFTAAALTDAAEVVPRDVLHISIPKEVATIGANAFSGLANITSFTVDAENTAFKAVDGVLFNIDGTTIVRYPSNRQSSFYIVPTTVTEIRSGAFDSAKWCTAIVTDLYDTSAWGSPGAVMINASEFSGTVTGANKSDNGDYTVYLGGSVAANDPVVLQGGDDPVAGIWGTPRDATIDLDENNRLFINVSADLCLPLTNKHYAQVYMSSWKNFAYGYLNGDTLEIHNRPAAIVGGEVYQWAGGVNERVLLNDKVYRLPSGTVNGSSSLPEDFADWSTIKGQVKKVDVIDNIAPTSVSSWFSDMTACTEMELANLNTEHLTTMYGMFWGCEKLASLDVSHFETENVTSMSYMFARCQELTSLNVSNFNTANVTNMSYMFANSIKLTSIDLKGSKFNTENVTTMENMFAGCGELTSLDISHFKTSKVKIMTRMFNLAKSLQTLTLGSDFNTENVTTMLYMFNDCNSLTSLDLSSFNTSSVQTMECMFRSCYELESLDLSMFNTSKVTNMMQMFENCRNLQTIIVSESFVTTNVTSSKNMFLEGNDTAQTLVGGKGTIYSSDNVNKTFARIDGMDGLRGYFTAAKDVIVRPAGVTINIDSAIGDYSTHWIFLNEDITVTLDNVSVAQVTLTCGEQTETVTVTDGVFTIPAAFVTNGATIYVTVPNSEAAE